MKKTVQVVMLPNPEGLIISTTSDIQPLLLTSYYTSIALNNNKENRKHLYFTSNEEIKEGNWIIDIAKVLKQQYNRALFQYNKENYGTSTDYTKVIATTDKSLNLPLIPDWFVRKYVELNGNIKEIEISTQTVVDILSHS